MASNRGFSAKQRAYFQGAVHRWNVKTGATRSGKTFCDYFVIPKRIRSMAGKPGLTVMLGNTQGTLRRNVIAPLQAIWGDLVGDINSDNIAMMFGEPVHCLGADKATSVDRIRGMSIKYCYGDEVVTWAEPVFQMLKSRLDRPYSCFDGTCNPDSPQHWFYKFLQSDADLFVQEYTLYDNPFLTADFIHNLENEYRGTVYFDRYILGHWVAAEGLIYRIFANGKQRMQVQKCPQLSRIVIGVDFGGSGSAHTFAAAGFDRACQHLYGLASERIDPKAVDPERLGTLFCDFVYRVIAMFGTPEVVYCDSAEQTLILGLKASARKQGLSWLRIENALKTRINDRIQCLCRLMAQGRFLYLPDTCATLENALSTAVWNPKNQTADERLDNGTTDIDTLDAFEYTFERDIARLIRLE